MKQFNKSDLGNGGHTAGTAGRSVASDARRRGFETSHPSAMSAQLLNGRTEKQKEAGKVSFLTGPLLGYDHPILGSNSYGALDQKVMNNMNGASAKVLHK